MARSTTGKLADQGLLEKIDKLVTCGVGEYVNLPQLVVIGDQSSGKSSVLEGLTKIPFPRDGELCTRFATQITFKRSAHESIAVSILPATNAGDEHKAHVQSWSRPDIKELTPDLFAAIILEARDRMGINSTSDDANGLNFSEDVFKIEISGPKEEHLSIVDVPGLFSNPEPGKTTRADIAVVQRIVKSYMNNPRSVMLTVVAANHDIANQGIVTMAQSVDKEGIRTLGIMTKPDLVPNGNEQSIMDMINGKRFQLSLGWQLVRNTGQSELKESGHDRDAVEARFFRERAPWNTLASDKCGVRSLLSKLQAILSRHIKREFPAVRKEVMDRLKVARQKLDDLGAQRSTSHEQRAYLTRISIDFERTTNDALGTKYSTSVFDKHNVLRLPTKVTARQDEFANDMRRYGHQYAFSAEGVEEEKENVTRKSNGADPDEIDETVEIRYPSEYPELEDCTIGMNSLPKNPKPGIIKWISAQHTSSRGFELGSIDPSLLTTVFRGQSKNWEKLALGFVSDMIENVHSFIVTLLSCVCHDNSVREAIMLKLGDDLHSRYHTAFRHVEFLLRVEREGVPMTVNHYFNDNLEKARQDRMVEAAEQFSFETNGKGNFGLPQRVVLVDKLKSVQNMSNREHVVRDFHDVLRAYYKVALKRFVDNVGQQAALYHLVSGPDSPLRLFSAAYVASLTEEQLEDIAGEDELVKDNRKSLAAQIATLEEGRKATQ